MRRRRVWSLTIRFALAIAVIAGLYVWVSAEQPVLYNSNVQTKQLLSYESRDSSFPTPS